MRVQVVPMVRTQIIGLSIARTYRCGAWRYELEIGFFNRLIVLYWGKGDE